MKQDFVKISLDIKKNEIETIDRMATKLKIKRSELVRIMLFQQLEPKIADWLIPLAQSKGIAPWQYVNIILNTFKDRCELADTKREGEKIKLNMLSFASTN